MEIGTDICAMPCPTANGEALFELKELPEIGCLVGEDGKFNPKGSKDNEVWGNEQADPAAGAGSATSDGRSQDDENPGGLRGRGGAGGVGTESMGRASSASTQRHGEGSASALADARSKAGAQRGAGRLLNVANVQALRNAGDRLFVSCPVCAVQSSEYIDAAVLSPRGPLA
eukprot:SAG11_NODE_7637_length_1118_cov_0.810599_1_plen_172_part_00